MDYEVEFDEDRLHDQDEELTAEVEYDEPPVPFVSEWVVRLGLPGCKAEAAIPERWIAPVVRTLLVARLEIFLCRFRRRMGWKLYELSRRLDEISDLWRS